MIVRAIDLPSRVVVECSTREKHLALPARHQHPPKNAHEAQNGDVGIGISPGVAMQLRMMLQR
jgi:hypothetical protein